MAFTPNFAPKADAPKSAPQSSAQAPKAPTPAAHVHIAKPVDTPRQAPQRQVHVEIDASPFDD